MASFRAVIVGLPVAGGLAGEAAETSTVASCALVAGLIRLTVTNNQTEDFKMVYVNLKTY